MKASALLLTALVGLLVAASGGAQAAVYTNAAGHYHFTAPDDWDQTNGSGGNDVTFENGVVYFGGVSLSVSHHNNTSAENTEAFLLKVAQETHTQLKAIVGGTEVTAAHTFTTGGGRLASEFVHDYTLLSISTRVRQVFFASGGFEQIYIMAMTGAPSDFQNNSANWTSFVNTFALDSEPAPTNGGNGGNGGGGGFLPGFEAVLAVAAVSVAVAVASRGARRS